MQGAHLCEVLAGFLVVLTASLCNQSFGMLSVQLSLASRGRVSSAALATSRAMLPYP
jgi:hypothetical protein